MYKTKAKGRRGSWFATVDGESIPCVHKHYWRHPNQYYDDGKWLGGKHQDEFIQALKDVGKVVLTDDQVEHCGGDRGVKFHRSGYIAVYEISNVHFADGVLTFIFDKRVADLA